MTTESHAEDRARRLWGAIAACQAAHHEALAAAYAAQGLTPPQAEMARALATGPLPLGELARALGVAAGNVTVVLTNLDKAGLASRDPDPGDRRAARATLTPEGLRRAAAIETAARSLDRALLHGLNPDEQEILMRLLMKLASTMVG